jgi:hypothetical protein
LSKNFTSCTVGHSHAVDWAVKASVTGKKYMGLVCGSYVDYVSDWAGVYHQNLSWSGVVVKRNVEKGVYDPEFISIEALKKEYN